MHFDRVASNEIEIAAGIGTIEVSDDEKYPFVLTKPIKIRVLSNDCRIAEERLLQLATIMGQTTIEGVKAEEAFRKLTAMALQHDYFDEHPDLYKKKKDKPTWSPGFGAPVRRKKK
jgi:hypothetical protein